VVLLVRAVVLLVWVLLLLGQYTLQDCHLLLLIDARILVPVGARLKLLDSLGLVGLVLESGGGQVNLSGGLDLLNWLLVDEVVELIRERDRILRQHSRLVLERRLLWRLLLVQILCEGWACERLLTTQASEPLQRVLLGGTVSLDREIDHGATHLHCFVVARQEGRSLLDQNEGAELALVVLKHELPVLKLDFGVAARHRDIVDAQVAFVAATQLEYFLGGSGPDDVNNSGSVLFLVK